MLTTDIRPGQSVQIVAARGVRTMEFSTNVMEADGKTVKVEPIYQDDKLVGFGHGKDGLVLQKPRSPVLSDRTSRDRDHVSAPQVPDMKNEGWRGFPPLLT